MASIEGFRLKINKCLRVKFSNIRQRGLKNKNFTIISNNCWGGMVYESYNLIKQSPTIGLFFHADDYIKFVSNIKYYINVRLKFIDIDKSKNKEWLVNEVKYGNHPIGVLDDIEIYFLHYKDEKEAEEKWNRRIERINFNNILFKFNDQNGCTIEHVKRFMQLPYENKLFFTVKKWNLDNKNIIRFHQLTNKDYIYASKEPFGKNLKINITKYLNNINK